ncbi:MAG TPA: endonuclease, partial [Erythrobacter sp.]|nr:endonuclease [Erythrobacter sp.]
TALSQELIERSAPIARRRVLQAGLRMAEYLDRAFEPGPLPEEDRD